MSPAVWVARFRLWTPGLEICRLFERAARRILNDLYRPSKAPRSPRLVWADRRKGAHTVSRWLQSRLYALDSGICTWCCEMCASRRSWTTNGCFLNSPSLFWGDILCKARHFRDPSAINEAACMLEFELDFGLVVDGLQRNSYCWMTKRIYQVSIDKENRSILKI